MLIKIAKTFNISLDDLCGTTPSVKTFADVMQRIVALLDCKP